MAITQTQRHDAFASANPTAQQLYSDPDSGFALRDIAEHHGLADRAYYRAFARVVGDVILGFYSQGELPALLMEEVGLEPKQAREVTGDLLDFLAPLDEAGDGTQAGATEPPTAATATNTDEQEGGGHIDVVPAHNVAAEIAETEAALERVEQLHTYESDMAKAREHEGDEHERDVKAAAPQIARPAGGLPPIPAADDDTPTYSSTQSALINEGRWGNAEKANTPSHAAASNPVRSEPPIPTATDRTDAATTPRWESEQ